MKGSPVHGVLIVDKPAGPTSHDVVAALRRTLGTRAVGHAGTLDPAATGVLVVAVGEATKLGPYLTAHEKRYLATIAFGKATTTLDRDGETLDAAPVPASLSVEIRALVAGTASPDGPLARALKNERFRREQVPPAFSAIKQEGRPVHEKARRGEPVKLAPRPVEIADIAVRGGDETTLLLALVVSKGYYVRSLARDLGDAVSVPAHLAALERTASGPFERREAVDPQASREELVRHLLAPATAACRALPFTLLSEEGVVQARHGKRLTRAHFQEAPGAGSGPCAWLSPAGALVAIGQRTSEDDDTATYVVRRGFSYSTESDAI